MYLLEELPKGQSQNTFQTLADSEFRRISEPYGNQNILKRIMANCSTDTLRETQLKGLGIFDITIITLQVFIQTAQHTQCVASGCGKYCKMFSESSTGRPSFAWAVTACVCTEKLRPVCVL